MSSLEHILERLRSPDNSIRQLAEHQLSQQAKQNAHQLVRTLIELISRNMYDSQRGDQQIAIYALILFRRICFTSATH